MGEVPAADPFLPLLDAHAKFGEKLTELETALDEMVTSRAVSDVNVAILDQALRFFREDLLPHFRLEDEVVLPPLEARIGRFGTLVNVIAYEHEEVRREIEKFQEARAVLGLQDDAWPAIEELNRHGIFAIQFLWDHFRKEKVSLFPTAREQLGPEELARIRDRLRA